MKAVEYIAAVKAKLSIQSTYALGKALKVSKQAARKYESGENVPGPVVAFRIAEILGEQPVAVIAEFEEERAERDGKADEADYLRGVLRRIAGGAMSVLLAAGLGGFLSPDANLAQAETIGGTTHRIRRPQRRSRRAGPWDGLAPA